jgi:hypothetical protein
VTKNEDSGFCDTFTDIGGAVAGEYLFLLFKTCNIAAVADCE